MEESLSEEKEERVLDVLKKYKETMCYFDYRGRDARNYNITEFSPIVP